ncbi:galacturonokinase isoform X2 [Phoenix dactylifera]|uniref:Galacturonokinase isoform X2 n=1 Tax=Phoenix dactylifera TaxID=42345 RepID=A0A8B8J1Q7_PHODC|nr:galacturonokinase isoform X2 [Phoenix dactylifera]
MGASSWPSAEEGGIVTAMTVNMGIILGFIPTDDGQVFLWSKQFLGDVTFSINEEQIPKETYEEPGWGRYARGALYALQTRGHHLNKGIIGYICGSEEHSSGLSSSAAVGIAYLLALENANDKTMSPEDNVELDRVIENEYLNLRNGILDQSAILLSKYGYLTCVDCKMKEHKFVKFAENKQSQGHTAYKILLAFSGLKNCLTNNSGYNSRVSECQKAARALLEVSDDGKSNPLLCDVDPSLYEARKSKLSLELANRARHYFSENERVIKGIQAWASGNLEDFGKLISESGRSSIYNYECGCEPMVQLYEILLKAPGVLGARFSGAGFRGCCLALVDARCADKAAAYVKKKYRMVQPKLANEIPEDRFVLICEPGGSAHIRENIQGQD